MSERIRVVVVDDDDGILHIFDQALAGRPDIELVGFGQNGREAIQLANRLRPDVIFLDINMPVLNGLEAANRIAAIFPWMSVAILTAEQSPQFMREAIRIGVREYLDKGELEADRLPDLVRRLHVLCSSAREGGRQPRGLASVWSFFAPKATSGCTTQAVNAGVELAMLGYRVLLVDLDFAHGDVLFYLKPEWLQLQSRQPLKLLANLPDLQTIEEDTVQRAVRRFSIPGSELPGGKPLEDFRLDVLPSPCASVTLGTPAVKNLESLLDYLVTLYDFVLLDLAPGRVLERSTAVGLDVSEKFFIVANRDLSSLKALHNVSQVLARSSFSKEKVTVLLSSIVEHVEIDAADWLQEKQVHAAGVAEIPFEPEVADHFITSGIPYSISDPKSKLALFSRDLVERGLNVMPVPGRKENLWSTMQRGVVEALGLGVG